LNGVYHYNCIYCTPNPNGTIVADSPRSDLTPPPSTDCSCDSSKRITISGFYGRGYLLANEWQIAHYSDTPETKLKGFVKPDEDFEPNPDGYVQQVNAFNLATGNTKHPYVRLYEILFVDDNGLHMDCIGQELDDNPAPQVDPKAKFKSMRQFGEHSHKVNATNKFKFNFTYHVLMHRDET
jgi:hypothetical protein